MKQQAKKGCLSIVDTFITQYCNTIRKCTEKTQLKDQDAQELPKEVPVLDHKMSMLHIFTVYHEEARLFNIFAHVQTTPQ